MESQKPLPLWKVVKKLLQTSHPIKDENNGFNTFQPNPPLATGEEEGQINTAR